MSTPNYSYNLGTGKMCQRIVIAEQYKELLKTRKVYVLIPPTAIEEFKEKLIQQQSFEDFIPSCNGIEKPIKD